MIYEFNFEKDELLVNWMSRTFRLKASNISVDIPKPELINYRGQVQYLESNAPSTMKMDLTGFEDHSQVSFDVGIMNYEEQNNNT